MSNDWRSQARRQQGRPRRVEPAQPADAQAPEQTEGLAFEDTTVFEEHDTKPDQTEGPVLANALECDIVEADDKVHVFVEDAETDTSYDRLEELIAGIPDESGHIVVVYNNVQRGTALNLARQFGRKWPLDVDIRPRPLKAVDPSDNKVHYLDSGVTIRGNAYGPLTDIIRTIPDEESHTLFVNNIVQRGIAVAVAIDLGRKHDLDVRVRPTEGETLREAAEQAGLTVGVEIDSKDGLTNPLN